MIAVCPAFEFVRAVATLYTTNNGSITLSVAFARQGFRASAKWPTPSLAQDWLPVQV